MKVSTVSLRSHPWFVVAVCCCFRLSVCNESARSKLTQKPPSARKSTADAHPSSVRSSYSGCVRVLRWVSLSAAHMTGLAFGREWSS